jgi:hypothetical protein
MVVYKACKPSRQWEAGIGSDAKTGHGSLIEPDTLVLISFEFISKMR